MEPEGISGRRDTRGSRVLPPTDARSGRMNRRKDSEVAMTKDEVVAVLAWCDNPCCGELFDLQDGWDGRCPSCLALADEHVAGHHTVLIEACVECRREPRAASRNVRRSA